MAKRGGNASMKDVAVLAGVSVGTVSNVLNTPTLVADATRERVEQAIAKLGWVRNESARQLRAGHSLSVGMIVMDIANPFFTDMIGGAEDYIEGRGHTVQLGNSAAQLGREKAHVNVFEQQRVRGVLLAPIGPVSEELAQLHRRGIPVVVVDRASDGLDCCSVSVDDVEGGRLAVAHLCDLGHGRIALVGGQSGLQQVRDRRLGAEVAAAHRAEAVDLITISTPELNTAGGVSAAEEITRMTERERPTAAFAANDLVAIGLLQGFVTNGLRVPDDIAIVGYDDILFAEAAAVPLSSVRQPRHALGRRAAELLFEEISAADNEQVHTHHSVRFTPELVIRRSSLARARGARDRPA